MRRTAKESVVPYKQQIFTLYKGGMCVVEIKEYLRLPVTERHIHRVLKEAGLTRTRSEAFQLAIKKGRKKYKKLGPGKGSKEFRRGISLTLRYAVLHRDQFKCVLCGYGTKDGRKVEVDHLIRPINGGKNELENLRTLCSACNIGRWYVEQNKSWHKK